MLSNFTYIIIKDTPYYANLFFARLPTRRHVPTKPENTFIGGENEINQFATT